MRKIIFILSHKRSFVECSRWKFGPYIQCIYVKCGKYMYGCISQTESQICQTVSLIETVHHRAKIWKKTKVRSTKQEVESWKLCVVEQNIWKCEPPGLCNEHIYTKYGPKCKQEVYRILDILATRHTWDKSQYQETVGSLFHQPEI